MKIHRIVTDLLNSNAYIIAEGTGAIIIDPCRNPHVLPDGIQPELVLLTHEHYDHIAGVNAWKKQYGVKVMCSRLCHERMQNEKKSMARYFEAFCMLQVGLDNSVPDDFDTAYTCRADAVYDEDAVFSWRGHTVRFLLLPGHAPGCAGILIDNCLFSGDSIFAEHETVLHFPGGSEKDWNRISLPKIRALPPDTIVYPGHFEHFILKNWKLYKEEEYGIFHK